MADAHVEEHSSLIQTPKQLAVVVLAAFLVPVLTIVLLIQLITGGLKVDKDSLAMTEDAVARRLKPVGEVALEEGGSKAPAAAASRNAATPPPAQTAAAAAKPAAGSGENTFKTVCSACHGTGVLGAPKLGDRAAWKPRIAQGMATLHEHALKGIRAMPPKGGAVSLPDADVQAAVDYMVGKSK
ncbi:MAG TPA: c-type cytochrome [Burkholderiales bacterium]|nr:c-type cytochrome [Burkholderiales bacterium]